MIPEINPYYVINQIDIVIKRNKLLFPMASYDETEKLNNNIEALEVAKLAVEKQIAKKVKKIKLTNGTINYGCPICKRKIISKVDGEFCGGTLDDYCNRCGQALDWSDENVSKRSNQTN